MQQKLVVFWFRRDLRLDDNAGLFKALTSGFPVLPLFIYDSDILDDLSPDDKRMPYIEQALKNIQTKLLSYQSTLEVCYGKVADVFKRLINKYELHAVYTNHDYEPYAIARDEQVKLLLQGHLIPFYTFKDQVIFERNEVAKEDGSPYIVYSAYAKKWRALLTEQTLDVVDCISKATQFYKQSPKPIPSVSSFGFSQNLHFDISRMDYEDIIKTYDQTRDIPSLQGTTHCGVQLRFGTISLRKLVQKAIVLNDTFLRELIWREFFSQLLWHFPESVHQPFKKEYAAIQWRNNKAEFESWCSGQTGIPIVDAGMRELNETGFMHNRVRMIAASFLVKDLLIDWRWGEAYFARKLLDFDLASNIGNWQWVAGCGCDAAPYFRIFNPELQAKKFDLHGDYIRKWIPELDTLQYPNAIVSHALAAKRCLKAYGKALGKEFA